MEIKYHDCKCWPTLYLRNEWMTRVIGHHYCFYCWFEYVSKHYLTWPWWSMINMCRPHSSLQKIKICDCKGLRLHWREGQLPYYPMGDTHVYVLDSPFDCWPVVWSHHLFLRVTYFRTVYIKISKLLLITVTSDQTYYSTCHLKLTVSWTCVGLPVGRIFLIVNK